VWEREGRRWVHVEKRVPLFLSHISSLPSSPLVFASGRFERLMFGSPRFPLPSSCCVQVRKLEAWLADARQDLENSEQERDELAQAMARTEKLLRSQQVGGRNLRQQWEPACVPRVPLLPVGSDGQPTISRAFPPLCVSLHFLTLRLPPPSLP
jgi:hypothetical protein